MSSPSPYTLESTQRPRENSDASQKFDDEKGIEVSEGADLDQTISNPGGAPTETNKALGQGTGWISVIFLNINMMIGTGVFATGGSLLKALGSPGLVLLFWLVGMAIAFSGLAVYLELSSQFPSRAGAEVVYLEQAYRRPKYFFPAAFACLSVLLSFSSSNAIVLSTYLLYAANNHNPSEWLVRGIAVAGYTVATLFVVFSTKWTLRLTNLLGIIKTLTLVFIVITGFVVLSGKTHIKDPHANFRDSFKGSSGNGNAIANSIVKLNFSFSGYTNAMNVMNEIPNANQVVRWAAPASLGLVSVLYLLANVAYFAAVPASQIKSSGTLVAALFFENVFGANAGARILPALVAISAFGNLMAVLVGQSRVLREIGRQGVLPYPQVWTSTWPFGTPLVPLAFKWLLTVIVIIGPPVGDAFNFIVDLQSYPGNVLNALTCIAVFILRRKRAQAGAGPSEYRAWSVAVIFSIAISFLLLVMPWLPPAGGIDGGDVTFFYATYCVVGLGILLAVYAYWALWIVVLPRVRGYEIKDETVVLADGSSYNKLTKVWNKSL